MKAPAAPRSMAKQRNGEGGVTRAWLTVEAGSATPSRYEIVPGKAVMLGRHGSNTIVLKGKLVSRWHAVILLENGKWIIRNLGQPINGTYVNGQPIAQQRNLLNGREIVIGDAHLRFKLAERGKPKRFPARMNPSSQVPPLRSNRSICS
jgi:hypothetical protein